MLRSNEWWSCRRESTSDAETGGSLAEQCEQIAWLLYSSHILVSWLETFNILKELNPNKLSSNMNYWTVLSTEVRDRTFKFHSKIKQETFLAGNNVTTLAIWLPTSLRSTPTLLSPLCRLSSFVILYIWLSDCLNLSWLREVGRGFFFPRILQYHLGNDSVHYEYV